MLFAERFPEAAAAAAAAVAVVTGIEMEIGNAGLSGPARPVAPAPSSLFLPPPPPPPAFASSARLPWLLRFLRPLSFWMGGFPVLPPGTTTPFLSLAGTDDAAGAFFCGKVDLTAEKTRRTFS